jgi:two-component system response regulator YesN
VVIVDDEEPVLDSFAFMLKNAAPGFRLAGKARSGYEALQVIYETKPDLVFMDINIPGMDGLQVISEVHKRFPAMAFILSTAYERFDLAQKAIPLGVFAYLVKPVSKKTFLSALEDVRDRLTSSGSEKDPIRRFLRETVKERISDEDWEQFREQYGLPSDKGVLCLFEFEEEPEKLSEKIAEKLSFRHHCRYDLLLNQGLFLISEDIKPEILRVRIQAFLEENCSAPLCRYGIGECRRGTELYLSYREASMELQQKRLNADLPRRERLRIVQLRRKMGFCEAEEIRKLFKNLWQDVFASYEFILAKAKMASIFLLLMDDVTGCYGSQPEEPLLFNPVEEILTLEDTQAWERWEREHFGALIDLAHLRRSGNFPAPLVKAIAYIHEHYAESLPLSSAAEAAQVSPAYLSRLFGEHLKTPFIDYLTDLRIAKAEKLLRESQINIKEAAFAVGYQDPNYFSKIFRKSTGFSPAEYREQESAARPGVPAPRFRPTS